MHSISILPILDFSKYIRSLQWLPVHIHSLALSGGESVLRGRAALCPISRLPRIIHANDPWLTAIRRAVTKALGDENVLIGSIGSCQWEYPLWFAAQHKAQLIVILPSASINRMSDLIAEATTQLDLDSNRTTFIQPIFNIKPVKEALLHSRDRLALALADVVYPIALRPQGFWVETLTNVDFVDYSFQCEYPENKPNKPDIKISNTALVNWQDYLYHWTRGAYQPWLGERAADYFQALTDTAFGNPRDALATLSFIIQTGILRGEGKMFRGQTPAVSFTSLSPAQMLRKRRFRNALGRMNFEPYGIAIPRPALENLGAKPVIYGNDDFHRSLYEAEKPFFQHISLKSTSDWASECEWRLLGDLDIASLKNEIKILVPTEADRLRLPVQFQPQTIVLS
ncbi:MAG: hypothetical protein FJY65_02865 [Calditrichaeota bacterium]|nr:hypothetical protein [Calditrichota bacterium]